MLTNQRLVFKPKTMKPWGGPLRILAEIPNSLIELDEHYVPLVDIIAVEPLNGPSRLAVHLQTGSGRVYLIQHRRHAPIFSERNAPYRHNAVERIRAAATAARG